MPLAPGKLASRLEVLAKRLSPAERIALAPQLSAAALAKATTGKAAVAHTTGDCAACNLLRQTLPQTLRAAGLPSARKDLPAKLGTTASHMAGARHGEYSAACVSPISNLSVVIGTPTLLDVVCV